MKNTDNKILASEFKAGSVDRVPVHSVSRRSFLYTAGISAIAMGLQQFGCSPGRKIAHASGISIQGFERASDSSVSRNWVPVSDRKIRVGIVGYGVCRFGAEFGFQNHPNVEIIAVNDRFLIAVPNWQGYAIVPKHILHSKSSSKMTGSKLFS